MSAPNDPWTLPSPMTEPELVLLEQRCRTDLAALGVGESVKITCSDCARRATCVLAFDSYNTNGDCLYDK